MNNLPTLSVVTVTYNAQDTILPTLQSVCEQTYPHIEYIIMDGKSTDHTLDIIDQSGVNVHHLVSEPDKGLYDAMNKGAELATGTYLCFLNAGDTFAQKDTVMQAMQQLNANELPDVIYGETLLVNAQREVVGKRWHQAPSLLHWKSFKKGMLVSHQAFWVKRTLFVPYNLVFKYSSDVDWCIRILKEAKQTHHTHQVLIHYLNQGMTTQNHRASLIERFRIMKQHYGVLSTIIMHVYFVCRTIYNKVRTMFSLS